MPTPQIPSIPGDANVQQLRDGIIGINRYLNYLLSSLDTLNINRLDAKVIKTGTLDANIVTIRSDLTGGAYVQIDNNGIIGNDGTQNTFVLDTNGDVSLVGTITATAGLIGGWTIGTNKLSGSGILEGGTVRTASSGARIELSGNSLKTFNSIGNLSGFVWGDQVTPATFGDAYLYSGGSKTVEFYDQVGSFSIRGATGATSFILGGSVPTLAEGNWTFTGSVSGLSTNTISDHNHGVTPGRYLKTYDNAGVELGLQVWNASGGHSHTIS